MLPRRRIPVHPGEVLRRDFLEPLAVSQVALAKHIGVPSQHLNEIGRGRRRVSPETAWLLAGALRTTPEFWIHLRSQHDLERSRPTRRVRPLRRGA